MSFDLVIFDCDGVLVDSEPIANRVDTEQLNSIGLDLTSAEIMERFVGRTKEGCIALATQMLGREPAGTAAGMTVFGYAGNAHSNIAALEAEGAVVFKSMAELPSLMGAMA